MAEIQLQLERTLAIIKPDAMEKGMAGKIMERIQNEGFVIVDNKTLQLDKLSAKQFYHEHSEKPFFKNLVKFMSLSPITVLILAKADAIKSWRNLLGETDPAVAKEKSPKSIRALHGTDTTCNACHGSDAIASAKQEIKFFFPNHIVEPILHGEEARHYLEGKLMPHLTKGLVELCKLKPSDPLTYLAEWLLANNPNKPKVVEPRHAAPKPHNPKALKDKEIIFVIGGPACGKTTVCASIADEFKTVAHVSMDDLHSAAEEEEADGHESTDMATLVRKLRRAIEHCNKPTVLVDGFPRSIDESLLFEDFVAECRFLITLDCNEDVLLRRLVARQINETEARAKLQLYKTHSMAVVEHYQHTSRVLRINADMEQRDVYKSVRKLFVSLSA